MDLWAEGKASQRLRWARLGGLKDHQEMNTDSEQEGREGPEHGVFRH